MKKGEAAEAEKLKEEVFAAAGPLHAAFRGSFSAVGAPMFADDYDFSLILQCSRSALFFMDE